MAISIIAQPDAGAPTDNADYTQQNLLINQALAQGPEILTDWNTLVAIPDIKQGTYIYYAGNGYVVDTADESIGGSLSAGVNYIALTGTTTLTATWITDITGYAWNPVQNGLYSSGGSGNDLVIKAICYLDGSNNVRGLSLDGPLSGAFQLADGKLTTIGKISASAISTDNAFLKTKIIDLGSWDMDLSGGIVVSHGLADIQKIREMSVTITNDLQNRIHNLDAMRSSTISDKQGGISFVDPSNITIARLTGGLFDDSGWSSTSINRGWVTIAYEA